MHIDLLRKLIGMGFRVCNWLHHASKKEQQQSHNTY